MTDEPEAMRYGFDGFGYKYIDSGSGSDWRTRHPDAEPLYLSQPTQSNAQRNTPIWTEAATIQTNGRWEGKTARSDALREAVIEECAKALEADAMKCDCAALEERECGCGAWCEWKSITSARAVEIVRSLQKLS